MLYYNTSPFLIAGTQEKPIPDSMRQKENISGVIPDIPVSIPRGKKDTAKTSGNGTKKL